MGYSDALSLAEKRLGNLSPEKVCEACGARYDNGSFYLPWFNTDKNICEAIDSNKILWLHYLTSNGNKNRSGRLIAYRDIAPALFYEPNFYKRAVKPLIDCFGKKPEKLIELGESLGGRKESFGDASVTIDVLPYLPLTFIIWEGDDEFPPDGNILFDETAKTWFAPEDLAVYASSAVYELIKLYKKLNLGGVL